MKSEEWRVGGDNQEPVISSDLESWILNFELFGAERGDFSIPLCYTCLPARQGRNDQWKCKVWKCKVESKNQDETWNLEY